MGAQLAIPATSGRSPLGFPFPTFVLVVNRRVIGNSAQNRLDPIALSVGIDEGGHRLGRRSNTSAWAKYADAFRKISFALRSSRFSRRNSLSSAT